MKADTGSIVPLASHAEEARGYRVPPCPVPIPLYKVSLMTVDNKQIVIDFIEAMGRGDREAFANCLAPGAIANAMGFAKISGTRQYDMMVNSVEAFKQIWPGGLRPEFKTVTSEGNRAVVEFEGNAKLPDGTPYCNQYAMVFTLEGGKIRQVNEYFCTTLADQVMLPALAKLGLL